MGEVFIVIPTYNESENIAILIDHLEHLDEKPNLIIVDDNSPDHTATLVENERRKWGNIDLQKRPAKLGIGSAIKNGMEKALSCPDCKYIVTMDADLSHNPQDIPRLLQTAREKNVGMVQGSRYIKGGKIIGWNLSRRLQSRTANLMARIIFGLPHEVTTYFRVYDRESAQLVVLNSRATKNEFALESAMLIKKSGLTIVEVPIVFVDRVRGKSKLKLSDAITWLVFTIKLALSKSKPKKKAERATSSDS